MAKQNRINALFGIRYPIISGGMVWCSGWRLASAVSRAGGLGLIGAGSMHPEVLREHIAKCRAATDKPFGVNVPLLYPEIETIMKIIVEERVPIVFTSAGNPKTWTRKLKDEGSSRSIEQQVCSKMRRSRSRCRSSRRFRGGRTQRSRRDFDYGAFASRQTADKYPTHSGRWHIDGRGYARSYGTWGRRRTSRHSICTDCREFGKRRVQTPMH